MSTVSPASAFAVVGTSHRVADVEVRERLHVPLAEAARLARDLAPAGGEAVVLSTCNRTEVYLWPASPEATERVVTALEEASGIPAADLRPHLYVRRGDEGVAHLFRVAAGLDSLLQGEAQILGQVRDAYTAAQAAATTGTTLNHVFRQAIRLAKRLQTETSIGNLGASVPAAAAELAARELRGLDGRRVLVIGAGKMGALATASLVSRGAKQVFVANHRPEKAERLAERFGGEAVAFEELEHELERADVVVSSTGCPRVILTADVVERALRRRGGENPVVLVDIAVPRDLDPAIGELEGCALYDIDDLAEAQVDGLASHRADVDAAERAIAEEVASVRRWLRSLDAVPAITALRARAEAIRTQELARSEARLRNLSEDDRQAVDVMTTRIVNKLLHVPTLRIKEAAEDPDARTYLETVNSLFDLDEREG